MQRIALVVLAVTLFLTQQACTTRRKDANQPADSTTATAQDSPEETTDIPITGHLADLGLTPDSHWRGTNLGDDFATVKATEKGEPFESDAKHVGYTVEFKNLESADMLYYQANQKVSAIEVDLFLNARQSVDAHQKELNSYFTSRYRAPKPADGGTVWTGTSGETITMKDVSKGKDFGLKIRIGPADRTATASAK